MAKQPGVQQGPLGAEPVRSHPRTSHSVGFHSTSNQLDTKTSTRQNPQYSQEKHNHAAGEIRGHIPSKHAAAGIGCVLFRLDFSQQIFEESSNVNFLGFGPVRVELFQTDGRTDITKIIVALRDFQKAPNNKA